MSNSAFELPKVCRNEERGSVQVQLMLCVKNKTVCCNVINIKILLAEVLKEARFVAWLLRTSVRAPIAYIDDTTVC